MIPIGIVAVGAVSALGRGRAAYSVGELGCGALTAIERDEELELAGLRRPYAARVRDLVVPAGRTRAEALLEHAFDELVGELDRVRQEWRRERLGLCIGTSGGDLEAQMSVFEQREAGRTLSPELAAKAPYFGPVASLGRRLGAAPERATQVLAACASSTIAIGLACRWLERGDADLVFAGGYDALSVFIAAGFEALGATGNGDPQPFRVARDGMAVGEGAALLALAREQTAARCFVLGFGASSDAVHITAPDRTGAGLAHAARAALDDAGLANEVDLVGAHATATVFNDSAEALAQKSVLGSAAGSVVVHPFKATIGHTMGAAGALESLALVDALERGIAPAAYGVGDLEPCFAGRLESVNRSEPVRRALKLSAAFGGANAALVLGREPAAAPARGDREVYVERVGRPQASLDAREVGTRTGADPDRLARLDPFSALVVAACAEVLGRGCLPSDRVAVVVGTASATLEENERFDARRRRRGAQAVEPRRFPATSPNLCAGHASIVYGLKGPAFAVGGGLEAPLEALLAGADLVASGDADYAVVVVADDSGPVVADVWDAAGWVRPARGAAAALLSARAGSPLRRERLMELSRQVAAEGGCLFGAEPGWPVLLAALEGAV